MIRIKENSAFTPDSPNDDHKPWRYKGFKIKWDKEGNIWRIYNSYGEEEWEGESRQICRDFIDSY